MTIKTVSLVGPAEVSFKFVLDGVAYQVANGTVSPDLPEGKVPERLFGLGFHAQAEKPKAKTLEEKE